MKQHLLKGLSISMAVLTLAAGCRKKDAPLPDNLVQFESTQQGFEETDASKTIKLKLSGAVNTDVPVILSLTPSAGLTYGTDFTTTPAAVNGDVTVTVLSGASEAVLTVNKVANAVFEGDESLDIKIESSANPLIIGTTNVFKLTFAEIISGGSTIVGEGGGATYGNKLFFDLSANSQVGVARTNWDLGFYTGNEFNVILNSSTAMMAKQIDKNDLNAVTAADTIGFSQEVIVDQNALNTASLAYIDYPDGDLTKTAIDPISATASENKVYIINRGTGVGSPAPARGWKKVRIIRNASGGYTLQHADINATSFTSVDIAKDAEYFFKYVSFETGATSVEPKKNKWDLAWTYFTNTTNFGNGEVPYLFQDIVLKNRNVEVAKVMTSATTYEAFAETDLAGLTWLTNQNAIASDWRAGGGPGMPPVVRTDRFYVIKDGDGNYYKLRFTGLTKEGVRGFPTFEYVLIKKA